MCAHELVFTEGQVLPPAEQFRDGRQHRRRPRRLVAAARERHRRRHLRVVAGQARGERIEPEPAADLAVGDDVDAARFLEFDRLETGAILDVGQPRLGEFAAIEPLERVLQVPGSQQAADDL